MPHPTLMPSSMSVGATWSLRSTTNLANCLTLMMYLGSSESALMIFVHLMYNMKAKTCFVTGFQASHKYGRKYETVNCEAVILFLYLATCRGCSLCRVCLSAARSQSAGGARPVSDSLMPVRKHHLNLFFKCINTTQHTSSFIQSEAEHVNNQTSDSFKRIFAFTNHLLARWSFWAAAGCHLPLVWSVWSRCFDPNQKEQQVPH